ncbi:hypothetical protein [Pseudomonas soli]|uniref:hypothetical protein n=1 Tax=Pseudomonas soli TaxID=1306993 RepID=UPI0028ACFB37|nr:hypothetical protein [Pseudomonas soli]
MKLDKVVLGVCIGLFGAGGIFFQLFKSTLDGQALSLFLSFVSAVGTVGAVIAAMYLSSKTENRMMKAEQVRAELEAARVTPALESLSMALDSAYATFLFKESHEVDSDLLQRVEHLSILAALISYESLGRMACLEDNCAHRIARAISNIEKAAVVVNRIKAVGWVNIPFMQRSFMHGDIYSAINEARELVLVAQRVCYVATSRGAPMPSGEEKYGHGIDVDILEE